MKKIILASSSPRRKMLLEQVGIHAKVVVGSYVERIDSQKSPHQMIRKLSLDKAVTVAKKEKNAIIIAADTIVVCDGQMIGKPKNKKDAKRILLLLSGKTHRIITGFSIIDTSSGQLVNMSVETKVSFKKLTRAEIDAYIKTGEPMDKAGAYGIQEKGGFFVEKIEGDYSNVVGLPIFAVAQELKKLGVKII